ALAAGHRVSPQVDAAAGVQMGAYRAVLTLPGGELPFGFELEGAGASTVAYLVNGKERVLLNEVTVLGTHLDIRMPGYENRLTADASGGRLVGEVVLSKPDGKQQHIALHAQRGQQFRFFEKSAGASADVSGRWAVKFTDDSGKPELAVGEFSQSHDVITGTFLAETGDHRYLAGQVKGDELYLSTFDGAHAFLYKAKVGSDGELTGDFWVGTALHERWVGQRDANASLPDAYSLTTLRAGATQFNFAFPDLAGRRISSNDPKFQGKVMIVALAGSWCPNCHDEAAFLEPLYKEYRGKGVEIVSLMFEHFGDFPQAVEATQRFRRHYGIEYTTLIAGISNKDEAAKKLPMLDRVYAFPTTLFVDRKGRVRKIHTGFSGPATGDHYTQFVAEVKATLDQLLAET
ncbi:MAG: TlpA disulfide reductase family protein, partial [Gammaproteobacteria bacterium]